MNSRYVLQIFKHKEGAGGVINGCHLMVLVFASQLLAPCIVNLHHLD